MKSWHVTSDQKGDKSQTKRRARGKPEEGGNLASSRAEVRELDRPLAEPLLTQRTPVHPQCLGLFLGGTQSVLVNQLMSLKATERSQSQSLVKKAPSSFQWRSRTGWLCPAWPTVYPLSWPTPVCPSQLCSLVTSLCPSGWWFLSGSHILPLSLYFRLSYPHLFPCLPTQLNYNFPMGTFHCAPSTQYNAMGPSKLCFLIGW